MRKNTRYRRVFIGVVKMHKKERKVRESLLKNKLRKFAKKLAKWTNYVYNGIVVTDGHYYYSARNYR